jgi:hypothetical protein
MDRLLARVRRLPDSTQKVVVFGVLTGAIVVIVLVARALA